ncbi:hypothetical protein V6N11_016478 [Hibiscus sabdariffa]|uniref:Uncharacterized protein n=1 Tax=Hibiscus sabdariffa TaxID=183260 RepID=A0ABR2TVL1_9ROSI
MSIRNCQRIEEILEDRDDDDHHNEISFLQLNRLELEDLPKPESFCSSQNYTFEFPSLEILLLVNCPKMKMFSQGDLKTLILQKVRLDEWGTEEHSGGNLNSTIYNNYSDQSTHTPSIPLPLVKLIKYGHPSYQGLLGMCNGDRDFILQVLKSFRCRTLMKPLMEMQQSSQKGSFDQSVEKMETSRLLKLEMDRSIYLVDGIKLLLRKAESLYLKGVKDVTDMLYDPFKAS